MKLDRKLLGSIFKRLTFIPVVALIFCSLVFFGVYNWYLDTAFSSQQTIDQKERGLRQLEADINQLSNTKKDFETFLPKYELLVARGVSNTISRVEWADRLNKISDKMLLRGMSVNFESEKELSANQLSQLPLSSRVIHHTRINISGNMQVDTDLMLLVNEIRKHLDPYVWVERCELRLNAGQDQRLELRPDNGNVAMRCDIHVFRAQLSKFDERRMR